MGLGAWEELETAGQHAILQHKLKEGVKRKVGPKSHWDGASDPFGIETSLRAKKRARARHSARGSQANAKAFERRPTVSKKDQRSPCTPREDVAEPEPLLLIGDNLRRLRVLRVLLGASQGEVSVSPCLSKERSL